MTITDLILVGHSVPHKHSSVTRAWDLNHWLTTSCRGKTDKPNHYKPPQPYFSIYFALLGGFIHLNSISGKVQCSHGWKVGGGVLCHRWYLNRLYWMLPPDSSTTLPESTSQHPWFHGISCTQLIRPMQKNSRNSYTSECRTRCYKSLLRDETRTSNFPEILSLFANWILRN